MWAGLRGQWMGLDVEGGWAVTAEELCEVGVDVETWVGDVSPVEGRSMM